MIKSFPYSFIQNTGVFGISFWVKFDSYVTIPQYIINSTGTTIEKGFYLGNAGATGRLEFVATNGINSNFAVKTFAPGIFTDNNWNHIVVTGNGSQVRVYKNGALSYTDTSVPFDSFSSGDSTRSVNFFNIPGYNLERLGGYLDEVGIWSRELTDAEALMLYNNGNRLSYPF